MTTGQNDSTRLAELQAGVEEVAAFCERKSERTLRDALHNLVEVSRLPDGAPGIEPWTAPTSDEIEQ